MDEKTELLKECPYCKTAYTEDGKKGVKIITREFLVDGEPALTFQVCCTLCRARGPLVASASGAVRYWNLRNRGERNERESLSAQRS